VRGVCVLAVYAAAVPATVRGVRRLAACCTAAPSAVRGVRNLSCQVLCRIVKLLVEDVL
jgi:hypothetical protein